MGDDRLRKKFSVVLSGRYFMNNWSVFGNLDCNSCPISQKCQFSALAMPLASEEVTPSLIILFIRLPGFFLSLLLIIGLSCFHRL